MACEKKNQKILFQFWQGPALVVPPAGIKK
jgi:hypothetical protein